MAIPLNKVRQMIREEIERASESFLPGDQVVLVMKAKAYPVDGFDSVISDSGTEYQVIRKISSTPHGNMVTATDSSGKRFYINPAYLARNK